MKSITHPIYPPKNIPDECLDKFLKFGWEEIETVNADDMRKLKVKAYKKSIKEVQNNPEHDDLDLFRAIQKKPTYGIKDK